MSDGGLAFPHKYTDGRNETHVHSGMTLRDYFAAKAMTSIIATRDPGATVYQIQHEAARAFAYADAMIKERDK
jgi:hypothetical protein